MSMTLFYTAITKDDFEAIRDGEKSFDEVQQQANVKKEDLDYYSMDFIEYCFSEDDVCEEPIKALLSEATNFDEISEAVMGATVYDNSAIESVITSINATNLEEFASNFIDYQDGKYGDDKAPFIVTKFTEIKKFFENARDNDLVIIGSAS